MKYLPEHKTATYRKQCIKALFPERAVVGLIQETVCIYRIGVLVTFAHWDVPFFYGSVSWSYSVSFALLNVACIGNR